MAPKKKTKAPRPRKVSRKLPGKPTGLGQIPAQQFMWPTRWESLSIRRRDNQGKPLLLDNGNAAIMWQAEFIVYGADGSRSTVAIPPCRGLVAAGTPLSKIEALALESCHVALRNNGARNAA